MIAHKTIAVIGWLVFVHVLVLDVFGFLKVRIVSVSFILLFHTFLYFLAKTPSFNSRAKQASLVRNWANIFLVALVRF